MPGGGGPWASGGSSPAAGRWRAGDRHPRPPTTPPAAPFARPALALLQCNSHRPMHNPGAENKHPLRRDIAPPFAAAPHPPSQLPQLLHPTPGRVDIAPGRVDIVPRRVDIVPRRVDIAPRRVDIAPRRVDIAPRRVDIAPIRAGSCRSAGRRESGVDTPRPRHPPHGPIRGCRRSYIPPGRVGSCSGVRRHLPGPRRFMFRGAATYSRAASVHVPGRGDIFPGRAGSSRSAGRRESRVDPPQPRHPSHGPIRGCRRSYIPPRAVSGCAGAPGRRGSSSSTARATSGRRRPWFIAVCRIKR